MKGVIALVVASVAMMLLVVRPGQAIITCGPVDLALAPCIPYLTQGGKPSNDCCNGVKGVQGMAKTIEDKRICCNCAKSAANRYANLRDDAAQALPMKRGVTMDIPVSRSVNCNTIN